jgi:hypothetical protein
MVRILQSTNSPGPDCEIPRASCLTLTFSSYFPTTHPTIFYHPAFFYTVVHLFTVQALYNLGGGVDRGRIPASYCVNLKNRTVSICLCCSSVDCSAVNATARQRVDFVRLGRPRAQYCFGQSSGRPGDFDMQRQEKALGRLKLLVTNELRSWKKSGQFLN